MTVSKQTYILLHLSAALIFSGTAIVFGLAELLGFAGFFIGVTVCEFKYL